MYVKEMTELIEYAMMSTEVWSAVNQVNDSEVAYQPLYTKEAGKVECASRHCKDIFINDKRHIESFFKYIYIYLEI